VTDGSAPNSGFLPRLLGLARGYMASRIFLTALELDVFDQLGTARLSASQLSEMLNTDSRATEVLLNALAGMGLLEKQDDMFANAEEVAGFLMTDNPHYAGDALRHNTNLWDAWSHLTEIVRTGRYYEREWTKQMSRDLASAMRQQAKSMADRLVRVIDCSNVNRLLDLGGGPGEYAVKLVKRNPHMEAVIFDRDDQALEIGKKEIEEQGLRDRISVRKGDFFTDDFGSGYDLALLSSIICILGEEQNVALLGKVRESLNDEGRVVIWDSILNESKTEPSSAAIFSMRMVIATPNGACYSHVEVKGWLNELGFKNIHQVPIDNSQLIIAAK